MNLLYGLALSAHMGFEGEYNSIHPHVRLEQDQYAIGLYQNSENNVSSYLSYSFEKNDYYLELGIVTGYLKPVPLIRAGVGLDDLNLFIAPGFESRNDGLKLVFGVEYLLGK